MVKGLSQTSSLITIGFSVTESAANTFTQDRVDLQLNPLDNEVFVVQAVNLDPSEPDVVPATNTKTDAGLTTTSRTAMPNLSDSAALAIAALSVRADATNAVPFSKSSMEVPPTALEYIGIISTNDFFVQVLGTGNLNPKKVTGKMYGYRAKASDSVYAALVQSEVLSS